MALEEYAARYFGSGAKPPVVLEHPSEIGEKGKKNLRKSWNKMHQGLEGSHRIAILEEGMQLKEYGAKPDESQALESRKYQVEEVARIFNMPPHRLKEMTNSTYSNITHQDLEYAKYTLQPWLKRKELAYTTQLLTAKQQKKLFIEHDLKGLLRATPTDRAAYYQTMVQNGLMCPDEIRELENLNPQPDGLGTKYYVPMNWRATDEPMPAQQPGFESTRNVEHRKDESYEKTLVAIEVAQQSHEPVIREAAQRIVNKEVRAVDYQLSKMYPQSLIEKTPYVTGQTGVEAYPRASEKFIGWMEGFYRDDMPDYITKQYSSLMKTYGDTVSSLAINGIGSTKDVRKQIEKFMEEYVDTLAIKHSTFSQNQLSKLLHETDALELKETLAGRLDEWVAKRAEKIAGDQIIQASNAVAREVYQTVGVKKIKWVTRSAKACPFCTGLNGKIVRIEQPFVERDETLTAKDKSGNYMKVKGMKKNPPIHRGCNCALIPIME
jgi:hypothetical protein